MGGYLVTLLVFAVPVVGLVMMLVWGFGSAGSRARRELARAYLIRTLIFCAAAISPSGTDSNNAQSVLRLLYRA